VPIGVEEQWVSILATVENRSGAQFDCLCRGEELLVCLGQRREVLEHAGFQGLDVLATELVCFPISDDVFLEHGGWRPWVMKIYDRSPNPGDRLN